jgi:phospholipid/cholesterol/gamma-HCH transport system permease protein
MRLVSPEAYAKSIVASVQEYSLLCGRAIGDLFSKPRYIADTFTQMDSIGVGSLPIVVLTGFFTGCVLALQSATSLKEFGAGNMTGRLVSLSMVKELAPSSPGLMVSGRNASGMASELGSMKVSEQIDAMRALGTDPIQKAGLPRWSPPSSCSSSSPSSPTPAAPPAAHWSPSSSASRTAPSTSPPPIQALGYGDVVEGSPSRSFSGFIIATVGCYYGLKTTGGTRGVGRSTTQAVVVSPPCSSSSATFLVTQFMIGIYSDDIDRDTDPWQPAFNPNSTIRRPVRRAGRPL